VQPPVVPAQAAQVQFLLVPGEDNAVIDHTTSAGKKQHHHMVSALEEPHDLTEENLKVFLDDVGTRAIEAGWGPILRIPSPANADGTPGPVHNILTHYGVISQARVRDHALTYINADNRNSQNSMQLLSFIKRSLTKEAKKMITNDQVSYTVNGVEVGAMLLKHCCVQARSDTQYSTKALHGKLRNITLIMEQQGYDIKKVNDIVSDTINSIKARGEEPSKDLLSNLFEGYKSVPDTEFVNYIVLKEANYDEEDVTTPVGDRLTAAKLRELALNKYTQRVDKGVWKALSEEQEQIVALNAQVETLTKKATQAAGQPKKPKDKSKPKGGKGKDDSNGKKKKGGNKKEFDKPAWMTKPSTDGSKTKTVNDKLYYWCPKHKAWVRHKPEECRLPDEDESSPNLQLSSALHAVMEDEE